jgi:radical SAM protein with 4Fe4S-binding SPASM domain
MNLPDCLSPHNIDLRTKGFWDKDYIYITLYFFDKCNLNCDFCFQDKSVPIDINRIKELPDKIIDKISPVPINPILQYLKFTIMGGELFSDDIPDSMFDVYKEFCESIISKLRSHIPNLIIGFTWMTNGVYTKHNRLQKFLYETNSNTVQSRLGISYDAHNRFKTDYERTLCLKTIDHFRDLTNMISMILTKQNINACISGEDTFLLDGNIETNIDMSFFMPNSVDCEYLMPDDDDLYNFFKWVADNNIFNIKKVNLILASICSNALPDSEMMDCAYYKLFNYANGEFHSICTLQNAIKYILSKTTQNEKEIIEIEYDLINSYKNECLLCKYNNLCTGRCWYNKLFNKTKSIECPIKRLYQYINDNPNITKSYIEWSEKHGEDPSSLRNYTND